MADTIEDKVEAVLKALKAQGSAKIRDEMPPRYGIVTDKAFGVPMAKQAMAKPLAPDHKLAEARIVACMSDDPELVTPKQMNRWRADFDNWAIVDTVCFKLFDRVPHAPAKIDEWVRLNDEFGRRAGFALLACVALHGGGKQVDFLRGLKHVEADATDERNFVKKGVSWALSAIGGKRDPVLRRAARELATRLSTSTDRTSRWIGKDGLRVFAKADRKT